MKLQSRTCVWLLVSLGACIGASLGACTAETAMAAIYFGGLALFAHWIAA